MKVAVSDWQGRVSPVFDVSEQVLLIDLYGGREEGNRRMERLESTSPHERAQRLAELGIELLVCGAISWRLEALLNAEGIRVIPLVCGQVEEVVRALGEGTLENGQFAMPGCCRQRRRGGRCRGGGGRGRGRKEIS